VVPAHAAQLDGDTPAHEYVWALGSHLDLGFNVVVKWVLADRLARPESPDDCSRHAADSGRFASASPRCH